MFGRSHLHQEWSKTTHIFQFHPGFLNFLHNQQLPVNNYISKTSVWFQLLLLQKLSWSPALNEARNKKPREPSTRRTELDGLVSPAVALHLETTGPLCADLFMSALRGSDTASQRHCHFPSLWILVWRFIYGAQFSVEPLLSEQTA